METINERRMKLVEGCLIGLQRDVRKARASGAPNTKAYYLRIARDELSLAERYLNLAIVYGDE